MIELKIKLNIAKRLITAQADAENRIGLGLARAADVLIGYLKNYSGFSQEGLHVRTGLLARTWEAPQQRDKFGFTIQNRTPYAAILNFGGDITPKKAGALAIPVGEALTDRGVARYTGPRDPEIPGQLFAPKGKSFLAMKLEGKGPLQVMFLLREKVTIPAYAYATKAVAAGKADAKRQVLNALKG